jgi:hypothetical protein
MIIQLSIIDNGGEEAHSIPLTTKFSSFLHYTTINLIKSKLKTIHARTKALANLHQKQ